MTVADDPDLLYFSNSELTFPSTPFIKAPKVTAAQSVCTGFLIDVQAYLVDYQQEEIESSLPSGIEFDQLTFTWEIDRMDTGTYDLALIATVAG